MLAEDVGPVHLRVEDRPALAAGAGDDVDVDPLARRTSRSTPRPCSTRRRGGRARASAGARRGAAAGAWRHGRPVLGVHDWRGERRTAPSPTGTARRALAPAACWSIGGRRARRWRSSAGWPGRSGRTSTPEVDSELVGFDVVDEHTAVGGRRRRAATTTSRRRCLLRALAEDHTVVGELAFTPDADGPQRGRRSAPSGGPRRSSSSGCTAPGQSGPADAASAALDLPSAARAC